LRKLVFVDAGVLIAAARGTDEAAHRALQALDDPDAEFASSTYVQLEVLPKAVYHKKQREVEFYEAFFDSVSVWVQPGADVAEAALEEAARAGLSAMDALHVASAAAVTANELLTSEGPTKPIHRTKLVTVRSIHPSSSPAPRTSP
jgi:predicted nucleic acid-binding protein